MRSCGILVVAVVVVALVLAAIGRNVERSSLPSNRRVPQAPSSGEERTHPTRQKASGPIAMESGKTSKPAPPLADPNLSEQQNMGAIAKDADTNAAKLGEIMAALDEIVEKAMKTKGAMLGLKLSRKNKTAPEEGQEE